MVAEAGGIDGNSNEPNATCPHRITMADHPPAVRIRGRLRSGTAVVFGLLGAATAAGLLFVTVSPRAEANPHHAVAVLLAAGAVLGAMAAAQAFRVESLTIGKTEITHEQRLAGICWQQRRMTRVNINALRVQARGPGGHGLAILGPQGRLLVGGSLEEADLEWLRGWVSAHLLVS